MCTCIKENGCVNKVCGRGCTVLTNPVPHKHAALIKAWADGASIEEFHANHNYWVPIGCVGSPIIWSNKAQYRIKPEPKPDRFTFGKAGYFGGLRWDNSRMSDSNVMYTFDGETGKLKKVELI